VLIPVASLPVTGFTTLGRLTTLNRLTRPKRVHLITARVFAARGFVLGIAPCDARLATCGTGNSHGELLSVHEINKTLPGAPKMPKFTRSAGWSSRSRIFKFFLITKLQLAYSLVR